MLELSAWTIIGFHDDFLAGRSGKHHGGEAGVWHWIVENHRHNAVVWREEDRARRTDLPDGAIVRCKRNIDRHKQRRIEAVEAIDDCVQAALQDVMPQPDVRLSSETAGAMIDRLSILSLKIHHMRLQSLRRDAGPGHVEACEAKLARLGDQRTDLAACLQRLLREAQHGEACFATYRQFKMDDDPTLNPEFYRRLQGKDLPAAGGVEVDVLVPTCDRPAALAVTLTALFAQTLCPTRLVVSDQGERDDATAAPEVAAVLRMLRARGVTVALHRHLPRRGLAEQRHFLLGEARAPYVLFLDDDVVLEPDLLERLRGVIREQRCGFVGSAAIGLGAVDEVRPQEQRIEFWDGLVEPEKVAPGSPQWMRHYLHSGANLYHVQTRLGLDASRQRLYRVAWIGGCVLFDTEKLRTAGGLDFWRDLPPQHCGEDVPPSCASWPAMAAAASFRRGPTSRSCPPRSPRATSMRRWCSIRRNSEHRPRHAGCRGAPPRERAGFTFRRGRTKLDEGEYALLGAELAWVLRG